MNPNETAYALDEPAGARPGEYLTFRLGEEEYGIDILKVQEIRGYEKPTRIAHAPNFIKGVVNLRGIIVPIVDLRIKLGLADPVYDQFTVVIILNLGTRMVGIVVDAVSDVVELRHEDIRAAPEFDSALDTRYILGLATREERMIIIVAIDSLMTSAEMALVDTPTEG